MKTNLHRQRSDERRNEVAHRLAALAPAGWFPRAVRPGVDDPPLRQLTAALPDLGPVFVAFGRYLSGRVDLVPELACRALTAVPDRRPPLPPAEVETLLGRALGRPVEEAFTELESVPVASTSTFQEHRARGIAGAPLVVRLARPELPGEIERDLALLGLLGPSLAAAGVDPDRLDAAADDFARALAAASDLGAQAAAYGALAQDMVVSGLALSVPPVVAELSATGVLTLEELPGVPLEALAPEGSSTATGGGGGGQSAGATRAEELAARLCQAWLRQACRGRTFPVELRAENLRLLPDYRIVWSSPELATLPPATGENLWEYLTAAAAHDPDRACAALLHELDGGPRNGGAALAQRLRQLVPFRDGGWGARDDLAGYLFLHWRVAAEEGWRPRPHLVLFYRGLYQVAVQARRLSPERDPLREGFEGARLAAGLGDVAGLLGRDKAQELLGSYAAALLAMPQRFNELLSLIAEGRASVKVEVVEPPPERRRRDRSAADLAVLLAMAAVALLAHHLASAGALGPWPERVGAVLLGLLGALLLRGRTRKQGER